jgi:hypothetical protein
VRGLADAMNQQLRAGSVLRHDRAVRHMSREAVP